MLLLPLLLLLLLHVLGVVVHHRRPLSEHNSHVRCQDTIAAVQQAY
jgi:hypothetical protein